MCIKITRRHKSIYGNARYEDCEGILSVHLAISVNNFRFRIFSNDIHLLKCFNLCGVKRFTCKFGQRCSKCHYIAFAIHSCTLYTRLVIRNPVLVFYWNEKLLFQLFFFSYAMGTNYVQQQVYICRKLIEISICSLIKIRNGPYYGEVLIFSNLFRFFPQIQWMHYYSNADAILLQRAKMSFNYGEVSRMNFQNQLIPISFLCINHTSWSG